MSNKLYKEALKRIINNQKMGISFESSELIDEIKTDIVEFGTDSQVAVWIDPVDDFVKDYDFETSFDDYDEDNSKSNSFWSKYKKEDIYIMSFHHLLTLVELQNSIFSDYRLTPVDEIKNDLANKSKAGKKTWANVSAEERKRIMTERGKAGAMKRWNKLPKSN